MKVKYSHISIAILFIFCSIVIFQYRKFRIYSSPVVKMNMNEWWLHINRYYYNFYSVPTIEDFFSYCKNDSFIKENFPGIIPKNLNYNDFVITRGLNNYINVWLFSETKAGNDTIFYPEMNFLDFISKRSVLLTSLPIPDPCGSENLIILWEKQRTKDHHLENQVYELIKILIIEIKEKYICNKFDIHCIHVYSKEGQIHVDFITDDINKSLEDMLRTLISSKFQILINDQIEIYFNLQVG